MFHRLTYPIKGVGLGRTEAVFGDMVFGLLLVSLSTASSHSHRTLSLYLDVEPFQDETNRKNN